MGRESSFFSQSKLLAEEFIKSVIIIDDKLSSSGIAERAEVLPDHLILSPLEISSPRKPQDEIPSIDDFSQSIDPKTITDAFLSKGIPVSIITPKNIDETKKLTETVKKLFNKTDIFIFDWFMNDDDGVTTANIIENYATTTGNDSGQLRLFVIYTTGSQHINLIFDKLLEKIKLIDPNFVYDRSNLSIQSGSVKIIILIKTGNPLDINIDNQVSNENLAERVIYEFTILNSGLLPNSVMKAITYINSNSLKILRKFNSSLDSAYLIHRSCLPITADAEDYLIDLISSELHAIIDESKVTEALNDKSITAWIDEKMSGVSDITWDPKTHKVPAKLTKEDVVSIANNGFNTVADKWFSSTNDEDSRRHKKQAFMNDLHKLNLLSIFAFNGGTTDDILLPFSHISSFRSFYSNQRFLTLGTVIGEVKNEQDEIEKVYICLLPKCDTVRLVEPRTFLFLPITIDNTKNQFDIIIQNGSILLKGIIEKKSYKLSSIEFSPSPDDKHTIKAIEKNGKFYFVNSSNRYIWLGELRSDNAIRLAHTYGSALTRIGIDEFEWQRRWARQEI